MRDNNKLICVTCGKQYDRENGSMLFYCSRSCLVKHMGYDPIIVFPANKESLEPVTTSKPETKSRFETIIE